MKRIIVLGNSHIHQYKNLVLEHQIVYATSIKGLKNPNSITGFNQIVESLNIPSNLLIFQMGQVDIEFGYYYKSVLAGKKIDFNEFLEIILDIYFEYLGNLKAKIAVIGVNPTVIDDMEQTFNINFKNGYLSAFKGIEIGTHNDLEYKNLTHIYNDDIITRNKHLEIFNQKLKQRCQQSNIPFFDLWPILIDTESNAIKKEFKKNEPDHHLLPSDKLSEELKKFAYDLFYKLHEQFFKTSS